MLPKWHIVLGAIFSLIIWLLFPVNWVETTIIFLSSVLIDVDHYLDYVWKKKDLSLKNAYKYFLKLFKSRSDAKYMHLFHTLEFIILLTLLSFFSRIIFFIWIGVIFHSVTDISKTREYSLIREILKNPGRGKITSVLYLLNPLALDLIR